MLAESNAELEEAKNEAQENSQMLKKAKAELAVTQTKLKKAQES